MPLASARTRRCAARRSTDAPMPHDIAGVPRHPGLILAELASEPASIPGLDCGAPWRCGHAEDAPVGDYMRTVVLHAWLRGEAETDELKETRTFKLGLCGHLRISEEYFDRLVAEWNAYRQGVPMLALMHTLSNADRRERAHKMVLQRRQMDQQRRLQHQAELAEWMERNRPAQQQKELIR
jgi:hypothetical protein